MIARHSARRRLAPALLGPCLALALAAGGCKPAAERALAQEALYDRLFSVQAYPAAVPVIQRAIALDSDEPRLWLKLGRAQFQIGNFAGAAASYQRAFDLAPDNVEALQNLALLSVRGGTAEDARRYIEPLMVLQPNDLAGLLAQGALALRDKKYPAASGIADKLISLYPALAQGYMLRARVQASTGRPRDAIAVLEKQSTTGPENPELLSQLLEAYQQAGDVQGIRDVSIRLAKVRPDDPRYAMESARAYHARGDDARARAILATLEKTYAGSTAVIGAIAGYWRATLPPAEARAQVRQMAAALPTATKVALANTLIEMGDAGASATLLAPLAAGEVGAGNVDAQTGYARALIAVGRKADARARLERVIAFDQTNVAALMLRARLSYEARDWTSALNDVQLAQSNDPTNQEAAIMEAQAYAARGDRVLAQQAYASALGSFPDNREIFAAYTDFLRATRQPKLLVNVLSSYARRHPGDAATWRAYAQACDAVDNSICRDEAHAALHALGARA